MNKLLLVALLTLSVYSCKKSTDTGKPITAITVNPETLTLKTGTTVQVKAESVPSDANANEKPFIWASANEGVATVTTSGLVKAVAAGSTEILVKAKTSTNVVKKIPVTVTELSVPLTGITVIPETLALEVNQSRQCIVLPEPSNATGISFTWDSDNKDVVTVSETGLVTAKTKGAANITVKSGDVEKVIPVVVSHTFTITIGSSAYKADTLDYEEVSPGVKWFKFNLPEFVNGFGTFGKGLVVSTLEVDLSIADNKIEVCPASQATRGNVERPTAMYQRKTQEYVPAGRKPIAAINGDFFLVSSSNNTGYAYVTNRPLGMEVGNGMLVQTPFSAEQWPHAFFVRDNGLPTIGTVAFAGQVDGGGQTFPLKNVNYFAGSGDLVLFNNLSNSYPTDSAFAWSPYPSTMVSLSYPEGGWRVNDRMEFTVQEIEHNIETTIPAKSPYQGKDFNGQGAILVGNGDAPGSSKAFLSNLKLGDKVGVKMDVKLNGTAMPDKHLNVIGYTHVLLQNGVPQNPWDEAHPRTAIGYSQDNKKVYLIVADGRRSNYSVGATVGQVGAILKALGAYTGVNLDGGGSSCMVVKGEVKNKPSDGSERAVGNGIIITTKK